jgi:hypothetical protein
MDTQTNIQKRKRADMVRNDHEIESDIDLKTTIVVFHCELNAIEMYWGYSKARFRQVIKTSFEHAKREVLIALDACSIDTVRRFCNRSFRFMDAYRKGLGVKVVAWCVKRQKRHWVISEGAMRAFEDHMKV